MAGNIAGGKAAAKTNKHKYDEKYKAWGGFYAYIGSIGGKRGHTGGFYANRELARRAGKIGGKLSRRGSKKTVQTEN